MFAKAAQIVDRNEPREVLRGINLSFGGITATNGKELLNCDIPLNLEDSLTIPLPLALIQSKATEAGTLDYWACSDIDFRFRLRQRKSFYFASILRSYTHCPLSYS